VSRGQPAIHHIEISMRENLWGYNGNQKTPFLKIILNDPKVLPRARSVLEQGEVQFLDMFNGPTLTFESNIAFLLRFMIDTKVPPTNSELTVDCRNELGGTSSCKIRRSNGE
jgi:DNA polymerase delta subunit 1